MALVTRCPGCNSLFYLTITELRARDGKVQCGQCMQLFDAFATLLTIPDSLTERASLAAETARANELKEISRNELMPLASSRRYQGKGSSYEADLLEGQTLRRTSQKWLLASLLMIVILAGQGIHFYRTELSIAAPGIKPLLEKYCMLFRCAIGLPKQIALLSLESTDLRINPVHQTEAVMLIATIRNHAPFPQELPALLLTLTDIDDRPLTSRILTAHDYVDKEIGSNIFAANSEIDIKLYFDNSELNAMGYRLLLYYP